MKRLLATILLTALVIGLLPACASSVGGGNLNLSGEEPFTLDPALVGDAGSGQFVILIFSGLVRLDDNLRPMPDIAREFEVSPDGLTYTFHLVDNARFHDGRQVSASDFKYSWERALSPVTGSQTAPLYLGNIQGAAELRSGETEGLYGVEVVDDYTLKVRVVEPSSYFLYQLSCPAAFVVDRYNVAQGSMWWQNPNGTGPFTLDKWDVGSTLMLRRNDLYYRDKAWLDQVTFHFWAGLPLDLYEEGSIDVAPVSVSYIERASDPAGSLSAELHQGPELSTYYVGFNCAAPPFDDPDIRRAFAMAIDKETLTHLVFKDTVTPAEGILPQGMPGFNDNLHGIDFDPEEALKLIRGSSYGSPEALPPITSTTSGWGSSISRELEAICYQWQENLGVEVSVRVLEPETFLYNLKEEKDEMFYWGWVADYPHPQDFLEILFASGEENNIGEYQNAEVDELLRKAAEQSGTSFDLYQQAEEIIVDTAACIPLWWGNNYTLVKPYVHGYELSPMGQVRLEEVWVSPH